MFQVLLNLFLHDCLLTFFCVGYTILDSVILLNGTVWLVTDDLSTFPALGSIASSSLNSSEPPQDSEWQILTTEQATKLGNYGAL
jgi:hypothetical protein